MAGDVPERPLVNSSQVLSVPVRHLSDSSLSIWSLRTSFVLLTCLPPYSHLHKHMPSRGHMNHRGEQMGERKGILSLGLKETRRQPQLWGSAAPLWHPQPVILSLLGRKFFGGCICVNKQTRATGGKDKEDPPFFFPNMFQKGATLCSRLECQRFTMNGFLQKPSTHTQNGACRVIPWRKSKLGLVLSRDPNFNTSLITREPWKRHPWMTRGFFWRGVPIFFEWHSHIWRCRVGFCYSSAMLVDGTIFSIPTEAQEL